MNEQRAFKDMTKEELRECVLLVLRQKDLYFSNLESALKELNRRFDEGE